MTRILLILAAVASIAAGVYLMIIGCPLTGLSVGIFVGGTIINILKENWRSLGGPR